MCGSEVKRLRGLVVLIEYPTVCARELHGVGNDGGEHRLQIQRRADRPADLSQSLQFCHRLRQVARAFLDLLLQAGV